MRSGIVALLILIGGLLVAPMSAFGTRASECESRFLDDVASLRAERGLDALLVDQARHELFKLRFGLAVEQEGPDFFLGGRALALSRRLVTDWGKWCFVAAGHDPSDVLGKIESDPGFVAAVLRPEVTSIAVAAGQLEDGSIWCAACVTRRLVTIDNWFGDFAPLGPSYVTATGTSSYENLRVRFYKGKEDPTTYHGEDREIDLETDGEGHFEFTLPISVFGPGEYQIVVYVLDPQSGTPEIALRERCHVPKAPVLRDLDGRR